MTLAELQKAMAEAVAKNDVKAMETLAEQIVAGKRERVRAENEKARQEAEKLAGVREQLATEIHKAVKALGLDKKLTEVKAWGFVYKVDRANPKEPDVEYKSVQLSTQQVAARKAGGGNGGGGKTRDEFGMSLSEIFDKFATDDDRAKLVEAEHKEVRPDSAVYAVKVAVKKRALAEGLLQPAK